MSQEPSNPDAVRAALDPVLQEGNAFVVRREDGVVLVDPLPAGEISSERSALQVTQPALYGYLLAANQRLSDASGCGLLLIVMLPAIAVCFGLHSQGFHGLFPDDPSAQRLLDFLASWWLYVTLLIVAFALYSHADGLVESQAYRREREGVRGRIAEARVDVYALIGTIEGDAGLDTIARHLKRDTELSSGF